MADAKFCELDHGVFTFSCHVVTASGLKSTDNSFDLSLHVLPNAAPHVMMGISHKSCRAEERAILIKGLGKKFRKM